MQPSISSTPEPVKSGPVSNPEVDLTRATELAEMLLKAHRLGVVTGAEDPMALKLLAAAVLFDARVEFDGDATEGGAND